MAAASNVPVLQRYGLLLGAASMQQEVDAVRQLFAALSKKESELVILVSERTKGLAAKDVLVIQERQQELQRAHEAVRKPFQHLLVRLEKMELDMRSFAASAILGELMRAPDTTPFFAHNNTSPDTMLLVRAENPAVPPLDPATAASQPLPPFIQVKRTLPRRVEFDV